MAKSVLPPMVRDAYKLSLTSAPLHAVEATINAARIEAAQLPPDQQTQRLIACLDACWTSCMFLFSAGQESAAGTVSVALEKATDLNETNARDTLIEALKIAQRFGQHNTAAAGVERHLLECGQLIGHIFAAGKLEGRQIINGVEAALLRPGEHKTI